MEETGDFPHHLVNLKDQPPGADKKLTSLGVLWLSLLSIYIYINITYLSFVGQYPRWWGLPSSEP